jgi:hypothetical protein
MRPWNNWYHVTASTYGAWLPGDARGFRTRHHREHVEGDYKHPTPPGEHDALLARSKKLLRAGPTRLTPEQRRVVCGALAHKLTSLGAEVVDLCVGAMHVHALVRFTPLQGPHTAVRGLCRQNSLRDGRDPVPRHVMGLAKKHASFTLREQRLSPPAAVWARRCKLIPVADRAHQINVVAYIRDHGLDGAVVWSAIKPRPGAPEPPPSNA